MTDVERILDEVSAAIESALGGHVELVRSTEDRLTIRFPRFETAVVALAVDVAERPSFRVAYPCIGPHHSSISQAQDIEADGVLLQGVLWIVRAVAKHGVALPEFPHPHILKQLQRSRRGRGADDD